MKEREKSAVRRSVEAEGVSANEKSPVFRALIFMFSVTS